MDDFDFTATERGTKAVLYREALYTFDYDLKDGRSSWGCTNKNCSGRLKMNAAHTKVQLTRRCSHEPKCNRISSTAAATTTSTPDWPCPMLEEAACLMAEVAPRELFDPRDQIHPGERLLSVAAAQGRRVEDEAFAAFMDHKDPLRPLREEFFYPKMKDLVSTDLSVVNGEEDCVYFCGNSLGLCPRNTKKHMDIQLDKWAKLGVQGHLNGELPWAHCDECVDADMAKLVGAKEGEIALMNGLTVNLHLLLISFYQPTAQRFKILCEAKAFPSDHYAFESQIKLHGYDPATTLLCMEPREGEHTLRTEDIVQKIEEEGDSIAIVCFAGVQYYTGQFFEIQTITAAGHNKGCYVGWDLAHAAGNVELFLHDWNVDFACWCTYKYMNSSAGSLGGFFLHERHRTNNFPKLLGWWGHDMATRFTMDNQMDLSPGAYGYRISNPPGLLVVPTKASLEIFNKTSMKELAAKSRLLTGYLELLVMRAYGGRGAVEEEGAGSHGDGSDPVYVDILTPSDPKQRGAQLSLCFSISVHQVYKELTKRGVVCDKRLPHVIRVAPCPLYCSFRDVQRFMSFLAQSLQAARDCPHPLDTKPHP